MKTALKNYFRIILKNKLANWVELCISDNSTNNETKKIVNEYIGKGVELRYNKNEKNLGYDKNVMKVLAMGHAAYLHLVSDEDLYKEDILKELLDYLKNDKPDCIVLYAHMAKHVRFKDRTTIMYSTKRDEVLRKVFSFKRKGVILLGLISCLIINRKTFEEFIKMQNLELYYGLGYAPVPLYLHSLKRARNAIFFRDNFRRRADIEDANTPTVIAFPSDQLRLIYYNYYETIKRCYEAGVIDSVDYELFKKNYLIFAILLLLEARTYIYPEIYDWEYPKIKKNFDEFCKINAFGGLKRSLLYAYFSLVFNPVIPYHWAYSIWAWYRIKIKKQKDVVNAHEAYKNYLSGKRSYHALPERMYEDSKQ